MAAKPINQQRPNGCNFTHCGGPGVQHKALRMRAKAQEEEGGEDAFGQGEAKASSDDHLARGVQLLPSLVARALWGQF